ncbi:MAG: SIMPL domain-containing protein [Leptolyngbyaceae cyanobacterium SL_7_1]|nr:SIMPL domain-containing protein [Leptolyngbyaceae cyanobacterium SL_7_1]
MKRDLVRSGRLLGLGAMVPLMLSLISLTTIAPAWAQEQLMRTITVSGQGNESIATSITQVRLGVEAQGRTAEEVQQEVARRSNAVVELVRSRNVSKLQTTGIYLSPTYDYSNNRQRIIGYTASNTISFEIATERAGTLLDDAVNAGASRIDGVSFIASDEARNQARQVALQEATQDALDQADAVLSAMGLDRQEVVSIQVNGAAPPMPIFQDMARMQSAAAEAAPTPVVGGEQEVSASVTLQIRY